MTPTGACSGVVERGGRSVQEHAPAAYSAKLARCDRLCSKLFRPCTKSMIWLAAPTVGRLRAPFKSRILDGAKVYGESLAPSQN